MQIIKPIRVGEVRVNEVRAPVDKEAVEKDYLKGLKYKELADKYEVTLNTIKSWKQRYSWDRKSVHTNKEKVCTQNNKKNRVNKEPKLEAVTEHENSELTDKQRLFCIYYIEDFNATKAYRKAYNSDYDTAMVNASKLLRNTKVKDEINKQLVNN